jgi:glycosyltransferase involved in cell wall biosynthesis
MDSAMVVFGNSNREVLSHPVHQSWRESIGADELVLYQLDISPPIRGSIIGDLGVNTDVRKTHHDIYILENPRTLYAAPYLQYLNPDSDIIYLEANWRLHGLKSYNFKGKPFLKSNSLKLYRGIESKALQWILENHVDGVIAVSEMMAMLTKQIADLPVEVTHPFVDDGLRERLLRVNPSLKSNTAVVVCESREHKGIDILVDAWKYVRQTHPNATLRIIGKGHPARYGEQDGIEVTGYVEKLTGELENASLYVHPARLDPWAVSTIEALVAGVPTVVTDSTGAKWAIQDLDQDLITYSDPVAISKTVDRYFSMDLSKKKSLSERAREVGSRFHSDSHLCDFAASFDELVQRI